MVVSQEFRRIVGRKPSEDEEERYRAFLTRNVELGGNLEGLKTTIKGIFLSPEAIYRMEFGLGQVDQHGRRRLSPESCVVYDCVRVLGPSLYMGFSRSWRNDLSSVRILSCDLPAVFSSERGINLEGLRVRFFPSGARPPLATCPHEVFG